MRDLFHAALAPLISWLNNIANAVANILLAPIGWLPGWLSLIILSILMGGFMLMVFKCTTQQQAIGKLRNGIQADLLALKLFPPEPHIVLKSQARILIGSLRLFFHSLRPMAILMIPGTLVLTQLGSWYQMRPLLPGEKAMVTMKCTGPSEQILPSVTLNSSEGAAIHMGPVRIPARQEIRWEITAQKEGTYQLVFQLGDRCWEKTLIIAKGFHPVSALRPGWDWREILLHPLEKPLPSDSGIQSLAIDYPERQSWIYGTHTWLISFLLITCGSAWLWKPILRVHW